MNNDSIQQQESVLSTRNPQLSTNINVGSNARQFQDSVDSSLLSNPAFQELKVSTSVTDVPAVAAARSSIWFDALLVLLLSVVLVFAYIVHKRYRRTVGSQRQMQEGIVAAKKLGQVADAVAIKPTKPTKDKKKVKKSTSKKGASKKKRR